MSRGLVIGLGLILLVGCFWASVEAVETAKSDGWIRLFNGKNFDGWKFSDKEGTFTVRDGMIVVNGPRSHLFYDGPVQGANFKNFEFKADVMTKPGANSGIYVHTVYQPTGWPTKGYESQVNQTHGDPKKTGGLYNVVNVMKAPVEDNQWYTQHIIVKGKHIIVNIITIVDGKTMVKTVVDYTEPENLKRRGPRLSSGTFALQGHDPKSIVFYKNIMVKPLPDDGDGWVSLFNGKNLDGWQQINGTAKYEVRDGTIVGTTAEGSPNSFLCAEKHYSDFELEFEVKVDPRLNSGVQFRSNSFKEYQNGRVHGYQVEIATNNAGRIYDEARRARWLDENGNAEKARQAFKVDEWNAYRVVCVGDSIKTWVNGAPIANVVDSVTKKGFIGLQVHSFRGDTPAQVRWRNIRIK